LPPVLVDHVQIQQVVVNLVRNAIEAIQEVERRELVIGTRPIADLKVAEVTVADSGPGIAPELAGQLFQPFVTTKKTGMGRGLSICREIVEAHHGGLSVAPQPSGGILYSESSCRSLMLLGRKMASDHRVYIVDDDEAVRDSLSALLEAKAYAVSSFGSALEFLAASRSLANGCVIADIRMPEMDGLELQQRLTERMVGFPMIIITGHGDVPIAVRAMKAGAIDFIEKPFSAEAMLDSVRMALSKLDAPGGRDPTAAAAAAKLALLSARERDVLHGLIEGLPNKSIAYDLTISPRTVEIHRARVMDKMGARSLSELVRLALVAGVRPNSRG
jgi:FixJ family two-component response regulator